MISRLIISVMACYKEKPLCGDLLPKFCSLSTVVTPPPVTLSPVTPPPVDGL